MTTATYKVPIVGTYANDKIIWKTDELRARYETPNAPRARAYITRPHGRYEVIVKETFMRDGILMARVCFVNDLRQFGGEYPFEFPATDIETEAGEE